VLTPVLAQHPKSFSLIDCIAVGAERMQRNFEPMRKQVETWQRSELTDVTAKVVIYEAFVEGNSKLRNITSKECGCTRFAASATVIMPIVWRTTTDECVFKTVDD
jgi:hypothetical protein